MRTAIVMSGHKLVSNLIFQRKKSAGSTEAAHDGNRSCELAVDVGTSVNVATPSCADATSSLSVFSGEILAPSARRHHREEAAKECRGLMPGGGHSSGDISGGRNNEKN
jgi:hypothetical protein